MDLIVQQGGHRYWWADVDAAQAGRPPVPDAPFTCLLWDAAGGTWPAPARCALLDALLAAGCRYLVCGGAACERWHDEADECLVARWAAGAAEAAPGAVMTTWHSGEPVADVAEFFVLHAEPPDGPAREHLVLQVGPEWDVQNDLMVWVRGWVEHPYGVDAQ